MLSPATLLVILSTWLEREEDPAPAVEGRAELHAAVLRSLRDWPPYAHEVLPQFEAHAARYRGAELSPRLAPALWCADLSAQLDAVLAARPRPLSPAERRLVRVAEALVVYTRGVDALYPRALVAQAEEIASAVAEGACVPRRALLEEVACG